MRKISLTDGKLSVEILPDCGGAISALRWLARDGQTYDLLRPARAEEMEARDAAQMSCIPVTLYAPEKSSSITVRPDLAVWTVQDASNVRATLTLHKEVREFREAVDVAENETPPSNCQLLQRFELGSKGLSIQLTITNIGVRPMPALAGLRLRPVMRGKNILRGDLRPAGSAPRSEDGTPPPSAAELAAGYRLAVRDVQVRLQDQERAIRYEWPEERLALVLSQARGFDYVGLEYYARQQEAWLTLLTHPMENGIDFPGVRMLQQGDSHSATLLLSAERLAAAGETPPNPVRYTSLKTP